MSTENNYSPYYQPPQPPEYQQPFQQTGHSMPPYQIPIQSGEPPGPPPEPAPTSRKGKGRTALLVLGVGIIGIIIGVAVAGGDPADPGPELTALDQERDALAEKLAQTSEERDDLTNEVTDLESTIVDLEGTIEQLQEDLNQREATTDEQGETEQAAHPDANDAGDNSAEGQTESVDAEDEPEAQLSLSQSNARRSAEDYLRFMYFSHSGLVEQLEYEGYSNDDAEMAVSSLNVDWNEQAAGSAQDYLDVMSFSRSGLIDQLIFEGFTREQAEYGVSAVGY